MKVLISVPNNEHHYLAAKSKSHCRMLQAIYIALFLAAKVFKRAPETSKLLHSLKESPLLKCFLFYEIICPTPCLVEYAPSGADNIFIWSETYSNLIN